MLEHDVRHNAPRAEALHREVEEHIAKGGAYEHLPQNAVSGSALAFNNRTSSKMKAIFSDYDDED